MMRLLIATAAVLIVFAIVAATTWLDRKGRRLGDECSPAAMVARSLPRFGFRGDLLTFSPGRI